MKVKAINVRKIFDSRGEPTIEVSIQVPAGVFSASVPSGKSRGRNEAATVSPAKAKIMASALSRSLRNKDFRTQTAFDSALLVLDGTEHKIKFGGNLLLGASIAFARARAAAENKEVWEFLRKEFFKSAKGAPVPRIFSNLINGGAHARNNLSIQEYMVVARPGKSAGAAVKEVISIYDRLGNMLRKDKKGLLPIGDEGGYAARFKDNFEPVRILGSLVRSKKNMGLALDAAATNFFKRGYYSIDGKKLTPDRLAELWFKYFKSSKLLLSIEDPFEESSPASFTLLRRALPKAWIVGDDLTTTDPKMIQLRSRAVSAVIIKPNQIGTVSEACEAIKVARKNKMKIIVSHRSGETDDAFIIQLARAANADGVKIGAPVHERMSKWNELLRLYP